VEWRLVEERWRLRHAPVDRTPDRLEHPVDRRDFDGLCVVRVDLEPIDLVGILEHAERLRAEVLPDHLDAAANRIDTAQP
jgi:hypothetical protein